MNRSSGVGAEAKPQLSVPARRDRVTGRRVPSNEAVKHAGDHRRTNTEGQDMAWETATLCA